jgi:nitrogen fixation NifU-like protein
VSDLSELYQELILDHGRRPRNFRFPDGANRSAEGHNPLCGDRLTLKLLVEDDVVRDAGFQSSGCAISTASASTMTEAIKGRSRAEIEALFRAFHALVTGHGPSGAPGGADLGKLVAFGGVSEFPMRVKCATLAWHTLEAALGQKDQPVTTE